MRITLTLVLLFAGLSFLSAQTCANRCLDFDGTGDYIQSATAPVTGNANFTMEARFMCLSTLSNFRRLLALGGTNTRIEIGEVNGRLAFYRQSSTGSAPLTQIYATSMRDSSWHNLALVRNNNDITVYLDCAAIYTTTLGNGSLNISAFCVGSWTNGGSTTTWWRGRIDEVRVWNTARTATQISAACTCGLQGNEAGLQLYYKLDQGVPGGNNAAVTTATDQTANANTGTLNTFALTGPTSNWICGDPNWVNCNNCAAAFTHIDTCSTIFFVNQTQQPLPPPYTYAWDFNNDGITDSTDPNPSWTPPGPGIYIVCLRLITAAGNVFCSTCQKIGWTGDTQPPVAHCALPFSVTIPAGGFRPVTVAMINNGSTDNCGIDSMYLNVNGFNCADACGPNGPLGDHAVVLTVVDHSGNTATCSTLVNVVDILPPTALCKDINVSVSSTPAVLKPGSVDAGSFDNCQIKSMQLSQTVFNCPQPCPMTTVVALTVTDCSGNSSTCTAHVIVQDILPPVLTCPPATTVNCDASTNPNVTGFPTVQDNCTASINPTFTDTNVPNNCDATFIRTWFAADACNNTSSCTQVILVQDWTPPTMSCPTNATVNGDPGPAGCVEAYLVPFLQVSDNCDPAPTVNVTMNFTPVSPGSNVPLPQGVTTFTYSAADKCGNVSLCTYSITVLCGCGCNGVLDVTPPAIVCPTNIFLNGTVTPNGCFAAFTVPPALQASDNCSITQPVVVSINATPVMPGGTYPLSPGVTTVICTATDDCGNTATCSYSVTVNCDTAACQCGSFTNLTFGKKGGNPIGVACNQPFPAPCPVAGASLEVHGSFACSTPGCTPTNLVWQLQNSSATVLGSGNLGGSTFTLAINGSTIQTPGTYTLQLQGYCGTGVGGSYDTCRCTLLIVVPECPPESALACGDAVVTCFGGPNNSVVAAVKKIQNVTSLGTGDITTSITTSKTWLKQDFGEVFGTAIDKDGNIYFTSTTLYGSTPAGPQGYGGLYKVDGSTLNKVTSGPWTLPALPNTVGPVVGIIDNGSYPNRGVATTSTHAPGLGTVAYDKWNPNQLFVTNFEDGKIYRIDRNTGATLSTFDPMGPDDGQPGFAPLGERIWGIGVNKNPATGVVEVYYAVWATDGRNRWATTPTFNTIRKVKLDGGGDFITGSDAQVIQLPLLPVVYLPKDDTDPNPGIHTATNGATAILNPPYSNPVSDFAFTSDGNTMLVTEHSMVGDMKLNNNSTNWWAHSARTMEYKLIAGNWVFNRQIPIGEQFSFTLNSITYTNGGNSCGGIDYANLNGKDNLNCDAMIWNSGDYLKIGTNYRVYGMQGFYTNQAVVNNTNSWLIDFDGLVYGTAGSDKSLNGDVEIFNCGACPTSCDSISAFATKDNETANCCYNLNLENQTPNTYTYVNVCVVDGGTLTATAAAGWTLQGYTGNNALFQPSSGGTVPVGSFPVAHFCLENLTADVQHIVVKYYDANFEVVCTDTIALACDACVQASVDSVYCNGWNNYSVNICIKAGDNLGYLANSATLIPTGGVHFSVPTPGINNANGSVIWPLPNLAPGATYCSIPVTITGPVSGGQQVCFYTTIHDNDLTRGESDIYCCTDTVPVCFVLPECDPCDSSVTYASIQAVDPLSKADSCCWKITVHNPADLFTGVNVNIVTPGLVFDAIGSTIGSGWSMLSSSATSASFDATPPQGAGAYVVDGWQLPVLCFKPTVSGIPNPQRIEIVWFADSIECRDTVSINCGYTPPCVEVDSVRVECSPEGQSGYLLIFNATNTTNTTMGYIEVTGLTPGTVSVNPPGVYGNFPPDSTVTVTLNMNGPANTTACFQVSMHELNDDSLHLNCCTALDTVCVYLPPCGFQCPQNIVQNGDFQQGLVSGDLNGAGNVWTEIPGSTPQVATNQGCTQNGSILMWGNQVVGEGIRQSVNFTSGTTYQLALCGAWYDAVQPNARLRVRATNGNIITQSNYQPCALPDCEEIFLTPVLTTTWTNYTAPLWTPQNNYNNLVVTASNNFSVDDGQYVSWVRVDDICIRPIQTGPSAQLQVQLYPNPATDLLNLAFSEPLPATATVRVLDMTGRLRMQMPELPAGTEHTELHLTSLTDGMYVADIEVSGLVAVRKLFVVHRGSVAAQK